MTSAFWEPGQRRLERFLRSLRSASHAWQSWAPIRTSRLPKSGAVADWLDATDSHDPFANNRNWGSYPPIKFGWSRFAGQPVGTAARGQAFKNTTSAGSMLAEWLSKPYQPTAGIFNESLRHSPAPPASESLMTSFPFGALAPGDGPGFRSKWPLVSILTSKRGLALEQRPFAPPRSSPTTDKPLHSTRATGRWAPESNVGHGGWPVTDGGLSNANTVPIERTEQTLSSMRGLYPPETAEQRQTGQPVLHLDGAALGRWAIQHLERVLSKPANGITGIDPRATSPRGHVSPF